MNKSARHLLAIHELTRSLAAAWQSPRLHRVGPTMDAQIGLESRTDPRTYHWDGLARRGDPAYPSLVFQYTLEGWGGYADSAGTHRVEPGMAFMAVVPSAHRYFLPADSPGWRFFWLILWHPYAVGRIAQTQREAGAVWTIDPESLLASRALQLFEGVARGLFADGLAQERAIFEFMLEYERFGKALVRPESQRDAMLSSVRAFVLENLSRPLDVAEIAAARGMSRSHFTHDFARKTGRGPAGFITAIRLEEASRRLTATRDTLGAIARAVGFADANHFCKVFRRQFHMSPGAFRRQMAAG